MILERIQSTRDIQGLSLQEKQLLAREIRAFMVDSVSKTGGHLSSNLGIVELTIAMYSVYDPGLDHIVWDVGHQCYVHKILTGRKDRFDSLRQKGGLSGFPRTYESDLDLFNTGHASNSISLAYGLAKAGDLNKRPGETIAVIGDGALTGGLAYEALNQAGKGESKITIILNDNEMSIGQNVGHLSQNLSRIRTKKTYQQTKVDIKKMLLRMPAGGARLYKSFSNVKKRVKYFLLNGVFFEEMGFAYLGPVDGHDIRALEKVMEQAKGLEESVIIHVRTVKGKGYLPAEKDPARFHGIGCFDPKTGSSPEHNCRTWSDVFGEDMLALAENDPKLCAVTAAMVDGTGLSAFETYYPERLFDVGIAESHAVTFAAGLAKGGMHPVCSIYSTFLQRAYDSILHDLGMNHLPVVLAVDRAGIVGEDGESHQGIYDLAYLCHIPGITVMAPSDPRLLLPMLEQAFSLSGPSAIRYPRGEAAELPCELPPLEYGRGAILKSPDGPADAAVLALGPCVKMAMEAAGCLEKGSVKVTVADARYAAPVDRDLILTLAKDHSVLVTVEDHIENGGFGQRVAAVLMDESITSCRLIRLALPDSYIPQGKRLELLEEYGISVEGIIRTVREAVSGKDRRADG